MSGLDPSPRTDSLQDQQFSLPCQSFTKARPATRAEAKDIAVLLLQAMIRPLLPTTATPRITTRQGARHSKMRQIWRQFQRRVKLEDFGYRHGHIQVDGYPFQLTELIAALRLATQPPAAGKPEQVA